MENEKSGKRRWMAAILIWVLVWAAAGGVLIAASHPSGLLRRPKALYEVSEEDLEGALVTVEVPLLYGCYTYGEARSDGRPAPGLEYIIDANDYSFCGLRLPEVYQEQAADLMAESLDFMTEKRDAVTGNLTVTGTLEPMDDESLNRYHALCAYDDLPEEDQARFLPLVLDVPSPQVRHHSAVRLFWGLGCIFISAAFPAALAFFLRRKKAGPQA